MVENLPETLDVERLFQWGSIAIGVLLTLAVALLLRPLFRRASASFQESKIGKFFKIVFQPNLTEFGLVLAFVFAEIILLRLEVASGWEIITSLGFSAALVWFLSRVFAQLFDVYLLDIVIKKGTKINELLNLGKVLSNLTVILLAVFIFAQAHNVNLLGLLASLGIGGLAVAFAAQKTLEQVLGGIVLYLDQPFTIDDYVGLPDGTFGRIESIGLRSTRIRLSGKGTLAIVPNNALTQMTIENFTGAKKVMAILYLNFQTRLPEDERALIRQVIVRGTGDIFGIDSRNTDVSFRDVPDKNGRNKTQSQVTFFILGSGNVSMEIRRQVLDAANQKIGQKLKEYGIEFESEGPTVYVDSPITI
ncbi:mechanosensitive ion channel family protein [Baaleninema sp.]|uniref:mechanosensitive ion channel family protein n=1 Tax=Baaleninema sp. TaxID=3101197 RepID=UPI003D07E546